MIYIFLRQPSEAVRGWTAERCPARQDRPHQQDQVPRQVAHVQETSGKGASKKFGENRIGFMLGDYLVTDVR